MMKVSLTLTVLVPLAVLSSPAAAQTTWYVDINATAPGAGTQASPYQNLQFALAQPTTADGDTLLVAPGAYTGGFDFLGKNVSVIATAGAATTSLAGPNSVVMFVSGETPAAVLDGFTVQGGSGTGGFPTSGGGVYVSNASPTLRNLVVTANLARFGGGMYFHNSTSLVDSCTVTGNMTMFFDQAAQGTGLYTDSAITVVNCSFSSNLPNPGFRGGGAYALAGTFTGCTFDGNRTGKNGGGVYAAPGVVLSHCSITNNVLLTTGDGDLPDSGAGVYGGTLDHCEIASNITNALFGAGASHSTLTDCVVRNNSIGVGAAFVLSGSFGGGGAYASTLLRCDVRNNVARVWSQSGLACIGGGVWGGSATSCRIYDNRAEGSTVAGGLDAGGGGAAFATLVDCDVFGNTVTAALGSGAQVGGGGVFGGSATRCRIYGNTAPYGAGALNSTLANCTVSGNTASVAGGSLAQINGSSVATNSILWGSSNPQLADLVGGGIAITWSDVEGGAPGVGNIASDPLFLSTANSDFHLFAASPCRDAGDPALFDPDGSRLDMGAYPLECGVHTYCVGKVNSLGCVPSIGSSGTPSLSGPDDFHVTCALVRPNSLGLLLWSRSADSIPFFNATLCLGGSFRRIGAQNAVGAPPPPVCGGQFDFFFSHQYMALQAAQPFETFFAQWYMRDATHPDGTGVGVSNALAFTICP